MPKLPRTTPPALRVHATGVHKVRFGGRDHYFTRNAAESARLYAEWLTNVWAPSLQQSRREKLSRPGADLRIANLAELYLIHIATNENHNLMVHYRGNLREFLHLYGDMPVEKFNVRHLQAFKESLQQLPPPHALKPKTIRHRLTTIKQMFRFGADFEHCREVNLRAVKMPKLARPNPNILTPTEVLAMIDRAVNGFHMSVIFENTRHSRRMIHLPEGKTQWVEGDPRLGPWLRLQYLTGTRPSELVKLMRGEEGGAGWWVADGVFMLRLSKCDHDADEGEARHIILSDRALRAYAEADRSAWASVSGYSTAARKRTWPATPKQLRASAVSHLGMLGVESGDRRLFLGHLLPGAQANYDHPAWQRLRREAGRLIA